MAVRPGVLDVDADGAGLEHPGDRATHTRRIGRVPAFDIGGDRDVDGRGDAGDQVDGAVDVHGVSVWITEAPGHAGAGGGNGRGAGRLDDAGAGDIPGVGEDERCGAPVKCGERSGPV